MRVITGFRGNDPIFIGEFTPKSADALPPLFWVQNEADPTAPPQAFGVIVIYVAQDVEEGEPPAFTQERVVSITAELAPMLPGFKRNK